MSQQHSTCKVQTQAGTFVKHLSFDRSEKNLVA